MKFKRLSFLLPGQRPKATEGQEDQSEATGSQSSKSNGGKGSESVFISFGAFHPKIFPLENVE